MVTSAQGPAAAPSSATKREAGRGSGSPVAAQSPPSAGDASSGLRHSERPTLRRVRPRLGVAARSTSISTIASAKTRQAVSSVEITRAGRIASPNSPRPSGMPR